MTLARHHVKLSIICSLDDAIHYHLRHKFGGLCMVQRYIADAWRMPPPLLLLLLLGLQ